MNEVRIQSIKEYIDFIEKFKGDYYFRGQADAGWTVEPNIFRDSNKLKNECADIDENYADNYIDIIKKILKIQHYGNGTRLCDVTVNPMVALYFAIEDESKDDKPCSIFIFDKSSDISLDSLEMKILLILTIEEISSLDKLQCKVADKLGIECDKKQLERIIANNYIINYDIDLSYSNKRALLQGGTGLYFGFGIKDNSILRKGNLNVNSLCMKITIPYNKKSEIRSYLKKYGISKAVMYDSVNSLSEKISYTVKEESVSPIFHKVILNVMVSDVIFVKSDIYDIVLEVFQESKKRYGGNAKIFIFVYYDEEDVRASNWIARPVPINDFRDFELNFNDNYHAKRMTFFNEEISIHKIQNITEPIVKKSKQELSDIIKAHDNYFAGKISRDEYKHLLDQVIKTLHKSIYYDLQDISHGGSTFDAYYENSNNFCMDVIGIAEDQIIYINRNERDVIIEWNYNMKKKLCDKDRKSVV